MINKFYSKIAYSLFFGLLNTTSIAQPTITDANLLHPGQYVPKVTISASNVTEGNSGINQTWDFSSVQGIDDDTIHSYLPSSTPYSSLFPTSNYVEQNMYTGDPYGYGYVDANSAYLLGIVYNLGPSDTAVLYYTDPLISYTFPMTYNYTLNDNYEMQSNTFEINTGLFLSQHSVGTNYTIADGYGTLITPFATYPNTLRLKTITSSIDSSFYTGTTNSFEATTSHRTAYTWISANANQGITFNLFYDTTFQAGVPIDDVKYGEYYKDIVTGINSNFQELNTINIYPNPANDFISLKTSSQITLPTTAKVINSLGETVIRKEFTNKDFLNLDIRSLYKGVYLIIISDNLKSYTQKFIKN